MRSQTTCSVSLFSSIYILTARLSGAGLSEVDLYIQWVFGFNWHKKLEIYSAILSWTLLGS